jgi:hypothetical protein
LPYLGVLRVDYTDTQITHSANWALGSDSSETIRTTVPGSSLRLPFNGKRLTRTKSEVLTSVCHRDLCLCLWQSQRWNRQFCNLFR